MLWGAALLHQLEAWKLGMNLKTFSSRRRILFYAEEIRQTGLFHVLGTVWEMVPFEHLETNLGGHAERLREVYSKLFMWTPPARLGIKSGSDARH